MKDNSMLEGLNLFDHEQTWLLLYFSASWCAPCKAMVPIIDQVSANFNQLKIIKIDVDEQMELAQKYEVRGVPSLLLLSNSMTKSWLLGATSAQTVERWLTTQFDNTTDQLI